MIRFDEWLPVSAEHLWSILGTVDRVDWVPGVTACELDGSVRRLHLPGAGDIAEEIKVRDKAQFRLVYQCIESPQPNPGGPLGLRMSTAKACHGALGGPFVVDHFFVSILASIFDSFCVRLGLVLGSFWHSFGGPNRVKLG